MSSLLRRAAATTGVALIALLVAAPDASAQTPAPTFGSVCEADPSVALLVRGPSGTPTRNLFEYSRDQLSLRLAGVIDAPVNAVALYDGYLYGIPEQTTTLLKVAADGTIVDTLDVPGFTFSAANYYEYFLSGTVDPQTGTYYASSVISSQLYTVDLNDPAAGVTTIDVTLDGAPYNVIPYDLSFYDGHLYGYDQNTQRGVRIDAATGEVALFPVAGLPNQYYGSSWVSPGGIFVLNRQSDLYEVDILDPYVWTVTRVLSSTTLGDVAEDGTACGLTPPPSFQCHIDPTAAFVTGSVTRRDKLGERALYRYTTASGEVQLDSLGTIGAPLNAIGIYDDVLYGYHRRDSRLFGARADGSLVDSVVVPGLPTNKRRAYVAGTIDKDTGTQYVFARGFAKAYAIDLADVAAGARKVTFFVEGVKTVLDFGDFAYYQGALYGYDHRLLSGFKIDVATGDVTLIPVTGIQNKMYPAVWFSEDGTLFLYKSAREAYEVDVSSDAGWTATATFRGPLALGAQRDGAHCGVAPAAVRRGLAPALPKAFSERPVQIVDVRHPSNQEPAATESDASLGLDRAGAAPAEVTLGAPFPNPARDRATFRFALPEAGQATIAVYDIMGRQVGIAFDGDVAAGWTEAPFEVAGLAAGTYIVRLQSASGADTGKLVVVD